MTTCPIDTQREALQWSFSLLEMVMADVSQAQAHWSPPGIANPIAATYAHAICEMDILVKMLAGKPILFETSWAGKTGISEPRLNQDFDWVRRVEVDLDLAREYARAVYQHTDAALAELSPSDLERELDLTANGLGIKTVGWCLSALVTGHLHNMAGEISALKGLQGSKGYPF
ncbi:MAG: hypothetical protein A2Z16_03910 [Chloroflexi bacterium RBG_16_54_18]|nr:MAG: hypothetical protein A2Z16_03910 [Chloroflexi bacterium RBG_16_54_18]